MAGQQGRGEGPNLLPSIAELEQDLREVGEDLRRICGDRLWRGERSATTDASGPPSTQSSSAPPERVEGGYLPSAPSRHDEGDTFLQLNIIEEALKEIEHPHVAGAEPPPVQSTEQSSAPAPQLHGVAPGSGRTEFNRDFLISIVEGLAGVDASSQTVVTAIDQLQASIKVDEQKENASRPPRFLHHSLSSIAGTLPALGGLSDDDDELPPLLQDEDDDDIPPLEHHSPTIDGSGQHDDNSDMPGLLSDDTSYTDEDEDSEDGDYDDMALFEDNLFQSMLFSSNMTQQTLRSHRQQPFDLPRLHSDSERDEETGSSEDEDMQNASGKSGVPPSSSSSFQSAQSSPTLPHTEVNSHATSSSSVATPSVPIDTPVLAEVVDFHDPEKYSTAELEAFCERKGILLKRRPTDSELRTGDDPAKTEYRHKLISLIKRYKEEEDEYEEVKYAESHILPNEMSAEDCKLRANALLTAGQYEAAVRFYTKAINIANRETREKGSETEEERRNKAFYFANRALAHLKWGNYASSVSDSTHAIELNPDYPKGYYRRGTALVELNQHRKAIEDFKEVLKLKPGDRDAQRQLRKCEQILRSRGFEAPRPTTAEKRRPPKEGDTQVSWAPPRWSAFHMPKLIELAAHVLATEIGEQMELYEESLKAVPAEYMKQIMAHMSWSVFQRFRNIPHFSHLMSNTTKYALLKQEEDYYRTLFVRARDHPVLDDLNLMLINPHEDMSLFQFEDFEEEERAIEMVFPIFKHTSGSAIVSFSEFQRNFDVFTEGQLRNLNWNNVLVAGGSVLASLMPTPWGDLRGYYHKYAYRSSDIDLFIYGLTPAQANDKLQEIYDAVKAANPKRVAVVRTLHTVTIVSHFPRRHIQIVLRLYKSPAEILMGFDGFDGVNVLVHPRCARALKMQYNLIDVSRRSRSYEYRLYKYAKRGFAVAVPGFDRSKVHSSFYQVYISGTSAIAKSRRQGLARLLLFEYSRQEMFSRDLVFRARSRYDTENMIIHQQEYSNRSDYASIHIPYGPYWDVPAILRHIAGIMLRVNDMWYRLEVCSPPRADIRPVAAGDTIQEVLAVPISTGEYNGTTVDTAWEEDPVTLVTYRHVGKDEMWITENPGSQEILFGSFHPTLTTFEEWVQDAYANYESVAGGRRVYI